MKTMELNTTRLPKELNFMLDLLKENEQIENNPAMYEEMNWKAFMELSLHHRLYPILYLKLRQLEQHQVPAFVMDFLRLQYKRNTLKMLHFSSITEQISRLLTENNIPVILLKGPALAHYLYGDVSYRTSSDLDFIVPLGKLEETEKILHQQGYIKDDYIQTVLKDWKWRHHHVTYVHPQQQIKIEIHWRLHPGPGKEPAFQELWKQKTRSKLTAFPVYLLGKEDLLLFLISHGARHGWSRLRWLVDIQYVLKQQLDCKKVNQIARKYHYHRSLGQSLYLATYLLSVKLDSEIKGVTTRKSARNLAVQVLFYLENRVSLHTDPVPEEIANYHQRHLFALKSLQQKIIFLISLLHPYPEDKQTLSLPKAYHFLYFPLRPFLWAWRKTKEYTLPKGTY